MSIEVEQIRSVNVDWKWQLNQLDHFTMDDAVDQTKV